MREMKHVTNLSTRLAKSIIKVPTGILSQDVTNVAVLGYMGIVYSKRRNTQPQVKLHCRAVDENNNFGDYSSTLVPITLLGQFRQGTIWRGGKLQKEFTYETAVFDINNDSSGWSFRTGQDLFSNQKQILDTYRNHNTHFLNFTLPSGGTLAVPCLEYFSSCYGRSKEIKRVLTIYPWDRYSLSDTNRLLLPIKNAPQDGRIYLRYAPNSRLTDDDSPFLAAISIDEYAAASARMIYAQCANILMRARQGVESDIVDIKCRPWFKGPAQIKVAGISFDNRRSFLALRVIGMSEPDGPPIIVVKSKLPKLTNGYSEDAIEYGRISRVFNMPNHEVITSEEHSPDYYGDIVIIEDQKFNILGSKRSISRKWVENTNYIGYHQPVEKCDEASTFSTGEPSGSGKGVGQILAVAPAKLNSEGVAIDMWRAAQYLCQQQDNSIEKAEWFTFVTGFSAESDPIFIGIPPFPVSTKYSKEIRWSYYDLEKKTPRGVLALRVIAAGKPYYILEIQRRLHIKTDNEGIEKEVEESFKGLIFTLDRQENLEDTINRFLLQIRDHQGRMNYLVENFTGEAYAFKHVPSKNDQVLYQTTVQQILKRMQN